MSKKTKHDLEIENEELRSLLGSGTIIQNCVFNGSKDTGQCEAVKELAIAVQMAAKALHQEPSLVIRETKA